MLVAGGSTNVTTYFAMRLTTDGKAATGLTPADFDMQYVRSGVAPVAKVDATALAATDSAHADNKIIEIDSTDQPGLYRADWPDAAFTAGVRETILSLKVATAFTEHKSVEIDADINKQGYNAIVVSTIASVTSTTVYVLTAGPGDNNALFNGVAVFFDADGDQSFRDVTAYTGSTTTITVDAAPDFTVVATDVIRIYPSAGAASAAEIADAVYDEARADHVIAGSFGEGVLVEDLNTAAKASVNTEIDGALNTAIPGSPTAGSVNEASKDTKSKLPSGTISDFDEASNNVTLSNAGIDAIFQRQMTEGYAVDGTAPTLEQAQFMTMQGVLDVFVSGATLTVRKLDGTTTAMVFTLNDTVNPTDRTRTS